MPPITRSTLQALNDASKTLRAALLLLGLSSAATFAADVDQAIDPATLLPGLARPAPASVDFTEIRFSAMLKEPLVISGTLEYSSPTQLDRHVLEPYREDTEIRGNSVRVAREGETVRTLALRRAPELQGILRTFSALLTGDYAAIEKDFDTVASGSMQSWQLTLTPRDERTARTIREIRIDGGDTESRCFWIFGGNDSLSVMLLGSAAGTELPQPVTREWLQGTCVP